jgi:hypothetical protein
MPTCEPNRESTEPFLNRRDALRGFAFGLAAAAAAATGCTKFADRPGPGKQDFGRHVNALSVILVGLVAQELGASGSVSATVKKPGWNDCSVTGDVDKNKIDVQAHLTLASCGFKAQGGQGSWKGEVDKSELNWEIKQAGPGSYKIGRSLLKADYELTLSLKDGKIEGRLSKPWSWDWTISGTYTDTTYSMKIHTSPTDPNFEIEGTMPKAAKK